MICTSPRKEIDYERVLHCRSRRISTARITARSPLDKDAEADRLCKAPRYQRRAERVDTRAGHYQRQLQTQASTAKRQVSKLRSLPFETLIVERYRRRESSVEVTLLEISHAGVSLRRVQNITDARWGTPSRAGDMANALRLSIQRATTGEEPVTPHITLLHLGSHPPEYSLAAGFLGLHDRGMVTERVDINGLRC